MKTKINFYELLNAKNCITLMYPDYETEYIPEHLSEYQKKRFNAFRESCKYGWYSRCETSEYKSKEVFDCNNLVFDDTYDETGRFETGYRVYDCGDVWVCEYSTNYQKDRDRLYIVAKSDAETPRMAINVAEKPLWVSHPIY